MNIEQIKSTTDLIRRETIRFCGGSRPTLDEIASFSILLACFTLNCLPYNVQPRINRDGWQTAVNNTVLKIITENF